MLSLLQQWDEVSSFVFGTQQIKNLEVAVFAIGVLAVGLTANGRIWGLVLGLANIILTAWLYFSTQLYSDFFLQFYYFGSNIAGIFLWSKAKATDAITFKDITYAQAYWAFGFCVVGTVAAAQITQQLPIWLPHLFVSPAAFPWPDAFILAASLCAQWLMVRRVIQNWYIWLIINALAIVIYGQRGLPLLSFLFLIYGFLALFGAYTWTKNKKM